MKNFHWGHGIALFFSSFVVFMLFMLYQCLRQDFDLVAADYYDQEINFQTRINQEKNVAELAEKPSFNVSEQYVEVALPASIVAQNPKGELYFFRPSSEKLDVKLPLQPDEHGRQYIPTASLQKGNYELQMKWDMNNKTYFINHKIYVQ